jgi:CDP-diacylglycerol--glycerol-3-phosphate 3-phosphatidyltransferase
MIAKPHIPNALSILRIMLIFPILAIWAFTPLPVHYPALFVIFMIAALSDFLDGYLARKWKLQSDFGAMIDQISDKLIVVSILLLLVADKAVAPYAPLIIILREIYVSGLREYMGGKQIPMPVSMIGKCKTATQMLAITALLAAKSAVFIVKFFGFSAWDVLPVYYLSLTAIAGHALLWLSAILALISAIQYTRASMRKG